MSLSWVDANTIRLDVIDGLNTTATDECGNLVSLGPPIRSINGIPGDANNNFRLEGSDCIDIEPGGSATLNITDLCSRSCCGCNELAALEAAQAAVEQQLELLRSQLNIIQGQQSALISNLISATVS